MNKMSEIEKAYIAGFFDGEGCISISKYQGKHSRTPTYMLHVVIVQKNDVVVDLQNISGVGTICIGAKAANAGMYQWTIPPLEAVYFLESILPYMKSKAKEAKLAIEFQSKQGHKKSGGRGWIVPQELIDEKELYYQNLRAMKNSGMTGRHKRK